MLEVNIKKKLRDYTIDLNFQVGKEEKSMGLLGVSGCGKSMTLKMIAGIESPDEGTIILNGKVLFDHTRKINLKPQQRYVGYLFQNYALFPNMTVEENIAAGLRGSKSEIKERVMQMIEQYRLKGLEKQYPKNLSGGQQQRVALARILAYAPDVLLLDEPFSAMDTYLKEELQIEVKELMENYKGITLLVTHDRDEVYKLTEQLLILDEGKEIERGTTKTLFDSPKTMIGAKMTGCKNISKAIQIGPNKVKALDWGITFEVNRSIPKQLTYIGIRSSDFRATHGEGINTIPMDKNHLLEDFNGWNILFREKRLAWNISKSSIQKGENLIIPKYVKVDPDAILLLDGDQKMV